MRRLLAAFVIAFATFAIFMTSAMAQNIGVSLACSNHLFLTIFREAINQRAKELGVKIQGRGAVETAVKLVKGEKVDSFVWIPFQLVTRDNYKSSIGREILPGNQRPHL